MPDWVLYTLGVLVFAFGLLASIALHEVGHLLPAKKFGVKVTQYMVGFGPTVWSKHKGETEYGVKAIPLGGYIRMIGMVPPRRDGLRSRWPRRMALAVEEFRATSRAEVQPGDEPREFYRVTPGKKMLIMLGGPSMNLVIYLVLTLVLFAGLGMPKDDPTTTVSTISKCVVPVNVVNDNACTTPNSPAVRAGLQPGDRIVAIGGTQVATWDEAVAIVEASPGKTLPLVVERDGAAKTLQITPVVNTKYANDKGDTKKAGFIGVSPREHHYYDRLGVTEIPGEIVDQVATGFRALGSYPEKIGSLWNTVFHDKPRDINGAIGVVGIGRLGGDFARSPLLAVQDKIFTLVGLLASVNLLLFLFNLVPLLPLDGGHVAGALLEAGKRGRARLRARLHPDSGQPARQQIFVDTAQMLPVMYAVASVLIVLTLLTFYADIVKPISLGG